jgi:hypothetical protein
VGKRSTRDGGRRTGLASPRYCFVPEVTASMTRSRLKLPGFCPGRELAEALQPLADVAPGGRDHEHVLKVPSLVADGMLCLSTLERVHAQVRDLRRAQLRSS